MGQAESPGEPSSTATITAATITDAAITDTAGRNTASTNAGITNAAGIRHRPPGDLWAHPEAAAPLSVRGNEVPPAGTTTRPAGILTDGLASRVRMGYTSAC